MIDFINLRRGGARSQLLLTASVLSLAAAIVSVEPALAADEPSLWIELGLHTDSVRTGDAFALPLNDSIPQSGLTAPLTDGLNLSRSFGNDGRLSFRPQNSHWVFSASVQYGRAAGRSHVHQTQPVGPTTFVTFHTTIPTYPFPYHQTHSKPLKLANNNIDAETNSSESHLLLDFQAGRDIGVGLFGHGSTSTIGGGIRIAQFNTSLNVTGLQANPDAYFEQSNVVIQTNAFFPSGTRIVPWYKTWTRERWHSFGGGAQSSHNFSGIGPSAYWDTSTPLWNGTSQAGFSFDWGVNAALLFGRQKDKVHHQTTGILACYGGQCSNAENPEKDESQSTTTRRTTVPNVGGFMGVSYRLDEFKASIGYRADFFFGALNTSQDGRHSATEGFMGPYARVGIGL